MSLQREGMHSRQLQGEEFKNAAEKVLEATRTDDGKKMKRYLKRYANDVVKVCTMSGPEGWSAVTSAADFGFVKIMKMFVEAGERVWGHR